MNMRDMRENLKSSCVKMWYIDIERATQRERYSDRKIEIIEEPFREGNIDLPPPPMSNSYYEN